MSQWEGLDRRRFPRVQYPCLVVIRHENSQEVFLTHTENVGVGGVCVSMKEDIKIFSTVDLEIDLLDLDDHIRCSGKVVWNVQRKGGTERKPTYYDIGIEFVSLTDENRKRLKEIVKRFDHRQV